jgi:hypothetical protein
MFGVEFDPQKNTNCHGEENCHTTEKSEAIAQWKEMLVVLVNKVVDKKRIIEKNGLRWREALGVAARVARWYILRPKIVI